MQEPLLLKIKQHDRVAQKQLYRDYVKLVSHICIRYNKNIHCAQDATQNTFVKIFQNIEQFDPAKGNLKSWIARIAVNESLALLRKQRKILYTQSDTSLIENDVSVDISLFDKLELEDVKQVIKMLDDESRIIMDLFFYEEYSHKEIAEILEISVKASRVRLHRAKKSFYRIWDKIRKNEIQRAI